jgi:hypothetical protein
VVSTQAADPGQVEPDNGLRANNWVKHTLKTDSAEWVACADWIGCAIRTYEAWVQRLRLTWASQTPAGGWRVQVRNLAGNRTVQDSLVQWTLSYEQGSKPMAKRKDDKSDRSKGKVDKRLQAIYAKSRAEFSAADLQKFTEIEEGIPFETIIAELERIHRKNKGKRA